MINPNPNKHETQTNDLSVMIIRYSLDSQHRGHNWHPANVSCI